MQTFQVAKQVINTYYYMDLCYTVHKLQMGTWVR